ncbi:YihY/virulence factor BrkB family protein [Bacillus sp. AFS002410]|uniref:YihY/virulence factor BrkB family protein n=1 Tax=Bacillus sp. AFS002410 TaxID=2033481 RepID=UPI00211D4A0F|nr:YihY/virulence factor BrkB family protein [Bacillus sp. AFS002410]
MINKKNSIVAFGWDLTKKCMEDEIASRSAELAYYLMLSLFPFLIVLTQVITFLPLTTDEIMSFLSQYAPPDAMAIIKSNLQLIIGQSHGGVLSVGVIATLWASSNGINAIIRALNDAYNVEDKRNYFVTRGVSIILTIIMIFVIVFALLIPVFGKVIAKFVFEFLGISNDFLYTWSIIRWTLSFVILLIVFTVLYSIGPSKVVHIKKVFFGSLFATLGWIISSFGFAFYVDNFGNFTSHYGSLGGIIVLMIWFFISAMVVIIGGELNALIKERQYGKIKPKPKLIDPKQQGPK